MKKSVLLLLFMMMGTFAIAQSPATYRGTSWNPTGNVLRSENGIYTLNFQKDGNLVLYKNVNHPIWASQTHGKSSKKLRFQDDGNFVIYDDRDSPIWSSNTHNKNGSYLTLQNDGNLVIYTYTNQPIWASNTGS